MQKRYVIKLSRFIKDHSMCPCNVIYTYLYECIQNITYEYYDIIYQLSIICDTYEYCDIFYVYWSRPLLSTLCDLNVTLVACFQTGVHVLALVLRLLIVSSTRFILEWSTKAYENTVVISANALYILEKKNVISQYLAQKDICAKCLLRKR